MLVIAVAFLDQHNHDQSSETAQCLRDTAVRGASPDVADISRVDEAESRSLKYRGICCVASSDFCPHASTSSVDFGVT